MTMAQFEDKPVRRGELRHQRWVVLGVVLLLLGAVAAPQVLRYLSGRAANGRPNIGPPLRPSPAGQYRGITLQLHSNDPNVPFEEYVNEIAQTGANTICLALAAYQENAASNSLFIEHRKVPPEQRLEKLIRLAHSKGLRVVLMPMVLLEKPGPKEWRGRIDPTEPDYWWEDYENYILLYARLAQRTKVEVLMVGSELIDLEEQTQRWRKLIGKVRKVYSGRLSYSANWDHYWVPKFWDELDIAGMTVYYDLVGDNKPSLEVLLNAWKPHKKKVLDWQAKAALPIMFTEVGWPSQVGCAKEPWNYYGSKIPDVATQAKCFQAFFETWKNQKAVGGVLIWEWRNHPPSKSDEVPEECSFVPRGKPAMDVIQEYFKSPGALARLEATTAPASHPTTRPAGE